MIKGTERRCREIEIQQPMAHISINEKGEFEGNIKISVIQLVSKYFRQRTKRIEFFKLM